MFDATIPNELILIAAEAIAHPDCGRMTFSMLDTCEWQVLISLDPSMGEMADNVYFIVRSRPQMALQLTVANSYVFDPDALEKTFTFLQDCVQEAIDQFLEIEATANTRS